MADLKYKMQIMDGMGGSVINQPGSIALGFKPKAGDDYVIVFVSSVAEVAATVDQALDSVHEDGLLWYCYPKKSSGIKTDINRDNGWSALSRKGYRGVRAISINEVWTGLRFREQRFVKK